jgi:nucleoside-diphosphate-sugar epimerase
VIFGAGQVGSGLARELAADGVSVRVVRHRALPVGGGIAVVAGDLADAAFVASQVADAAVVYHCANAPYDSAAWERVLPGWTDNLLAAVRGRAARLVILDNVYAFGMGAGGKLGPDQPLAPRSRKGALRARLAERIRAAQRSGDARIVVARASDFWGPGATDTYFGDQFWPAALAGKAVDWPVRADTPHSYHYLPDVVTGLRVLGAAEPDVEGREWMLPCLPPIPSSDLVAHLSRELALPIRLRVTPRPVLAVLAMFVPILRELGDMRYQWDGRFEVDDSAFRARFPSVHPTPLASAVSATVAWARTHYASASGAGVAKR